MSLKSVNLNLLPVLRELLRLRSVSGAARSLGRSPPAISEGLAQLRLVLGDPLLVRVGGGMELTARAEELVDGVEMACAGLEGLFQTGAFDPLKTDRAIVIAASDYHVFILGPELVRLFQDIAPGLTLRFVDMDSDLGRHFASRDIDLALVPDFHIGDLVTARVVQRPLIEDRSVVMMRAGHPLAARDHVDLDGLADYEHVSFHPSWEPVDYRRAINTIRRHMPARVRVGHVTMLPFFLTDSDLIALAPERLARRIGPALGLVHRPIPKGEPVIRSVIAWSPLQDSDPAHAWVREQILNWASVQEPDT